MTRPNPRRAGAACQKSLKARLLAAGAGTATGLPVLHVSICYIRDSAIQLRRNTAIGELRAIRQVPIQPAKATISAAAPTKAASAANGGA